MVDHMCNLCVSPYRLLASPQTCPWLLMPWHATSSRKSQFSGIVQVHPTGHLLWASFLTFTALYIIKCPIRIFNVSLSHWVFTVYQALCWGFFSLLGVRLLPFSLCIPESPPSDIVDPQQASATTELKCYRWNAPVPGQLASLCFHPTCRELTAQTVPSDLSNSSFC